MTLLPSCPWTPVSRLERCRKLPDSYKQLRIAHMGSKALSLSRQIYHSSLCVGHDLDFILWNTDVRVVAGCKLDST
ncbi:hypothetical protein CERSUDRAFT_86485 [Gelatoporia subvermispora B]|uniref:Uncharacterized protein n=1 Tax=Ceriporiopsis subvermispora (strain B) TaxID=914234 RepID=M2R7I0_CERS8|nr:hypothetical protein CERSUDRAFT_86485 [Gelatoporia subvermispora B]